MEADDILPDQVEVGGPISFIQLPVTAVTVIAQTGDVIGQCVQPHIGHMLRIEIYRDPPLEGGAGYAEVLEPGEEEIVHHLIFPGYGLDKVRVAVDMLDQPVGVLAHTEEVGLLLSRLDRASTVGTLAVHQLGLREKGFAGSTVQPFIIAFIDIALIVQLLEDLLHLGLMVCVRGADELIIGGVHQIPDPLDLPGHVIHEGLRRHPGRLRLQLDLLPMLVRTGLETDIKALLSFKAGDTVSQHDLIGVPDVGLAGGVGDRCGDIIGFLTGSAHSLLFLSAYFCLFTALFRPFCLSCVPLGVRLPQKHPGAGGP